MIGKKSLAALIAGSLIALGACGQRQADADVSRSVSDIVVNTDLQSVGNPEAVRFWQSLDADLKTAVAAEMANEIDPTGSVVTVDVDELSLAGLYTAPIGTQSRLSGRVTVTAFGSGEELGVYGVTASSSQAATFLPAGTDITTLSPSSAAYYAAVVRAFASGVASVVRSVPVES